LRPPSWRANLSRGHEILVMLPTEDVRLSSLPRAGWLYGGQAQVDQGQRKFNFVITTLYAFPFACLSEFFDNRMA